MSGSCFITLCIFETHWKFFLTFNPFTAPACEIFGLKKCSKNTLVNSIVHSPVTNLISTLCILIEFLSRAHAKRGNASMVLSLALLLVVFPVMVGKQGSKRVNMFWFCSITLDPYTLCVWLQNTPVQIWLYDVHRTYAEMASVSRNTSHVIIKQRCI